MNHKEIKCEDVDWMHIAQDWDQRQTLLNVIMNLRVDKRRKFWLT